jgi:hypothetical protein
MSIWSRVPPSERVCGPDRDLWTGLYRRPRGSAIGGCIRPSLRRNHFGAAAQWKEDVQVWRLLLHVCTVLYSLHHRCAIKAQKSLLRYIRSCRAVVRGSRRSPYSCMCAV